MDGWMSSVESLWNFFISIIWRLWICYAVIVIIHVKYGGSLSSNAVSEGSKTNVIKTSQSARVRKIIQTVKKLMRLNKLDDALAILNQETPLSEEVLESDESCESCEKQFLTGYVHEIRALCLYRKGDVMGSMVEMDRGLVVVKNPDSKLLASANHCFQLFHKWCCENCSHFQQDIVIYFQDKKKRLQSGALLKMVSTSLLMESIHCLILSDFLVRRKILEAQESNDLKKLCEQFYHSLNSEGSDDRILNSLSSAGKPLDTERSKNEIKYNKTEEIPSYKWGLKLGGSESPVFRQQSDTSRLEVEEKGQHEFEHFSYDPNFFRSMHEAYTTQSTGTSLAEVNGVEMLQHVPVNTDSLEPILYCRGVNSQELAQIYDNPEVAEGPHECEHLSDDTKFVKTMHEAYTTPSVGLSYAEVKEVEELTPSVGGSLAEVKEVEELEHVPGNVDSQQLLVSHGLYSPELTQIYGHGEVDEGPHKFKRFSDDEKFLKAMHEAYTTPFTGESLHGPVFSDSLEPILDCYEACGLELTQISGSPEEDEGPHEFECLLHDPKFVKAMHEAYTITSTGRSLAEVNEVEELQHVPVNANSQEPILGCHVAYSQELTQIYDHSAEVVEGPHQCEHLSDVQKFVKTRHEAYTTTSTGRSIAEVKEVDELEQGPVNVDSQEPLLDSCGLCSPELTQIYGNQEVDEGSHQFKHFSDDQKFLKAMHEAFATPFTGGSLHGPVFADSLEPILDCYEACGLELMKISGSPEVDDVTPEFKCFSDDPKFVKAMREAYTTSFTGGSLHVPEFADSLEPILDSRVAYSQDLMQIYDSPEVVEGPHEFEHSSDDTKFVKVRHETYTTPSTGRSLAEVNKVEESPYVPMNADSQEPIPDCHIAYCQEFTQISDIPVVELENVADESNHLEAVHDACTRSQ